MHVQKSIFDDREGEAFQLHGVIEPPVELTLTEVTSPGSLIEQRARGMGAREPFNLLFRGPLEPFLEQHMYLLQHDKLGEIELFLVPVGQDEQGYYYEAIFA